MRPLLLRGPDGAVSGRRTARQAESPIPAPAGSESDPHPQPAARTPNPAPRTPSPLGVMHCAAARFGWPLV